MKFQTPLAVTAIAIAALATGCTTTTRTTASGEKQTTVVTTPATTTTVTTPSGTASTTGTTPMGAPSAAHGGVTVPAGANDANAPVPGANKAEKGVGQAGGGAAGSGTR